VDVNEWLSETRLVVCVGSGGVGKTTTAATIALWGAVHGRKALVLTIDPARRLANSLGLTRFGNEEMRIDLSVIPEARGELWAVMLDSQTTFDGLIKRIAPSEEVRQRILANHVYRHMADTFAGSQDYMATEKLYDMSVSGQYDLLVLDTPPVKNALDFLESPGRLINFLDERVLKWFLAPYESNRKVGRRLMAGTSTVVYWLLGQVFGKDFLDDLAGFFQDFQGLYEGFQLRHDAVLEMFRDTKTGFVTVCAPTEPSVDVASYFQEELAARRLPRGGLIVNQVHHCAGTEHDATVMLASIARETAPDLSEAVVNSVLARLGMAHRRLRELAVTERVMTERVRRSGQGGGFYQEIPRLVGEVHDLPALYEVGRNLFGRPGLRL
jgi:anion-transporting  ArsA/GET3 family ATPase